MAADLGCEENCVRKRNIFIAVMFAGGALVLCTVWFFCAGGQKGSPLNEDGEKGQSWQRQEKTETIRTGEAGKPEACRVTGYIVSGDGEQFKLPPHKGFTPVKVSLLRVLQGVRTLIQQRQAADGSFAFEKVVSGEYCVEVSSAAYQVHGENCFHIEPTESEVAVTVVLDKGPCYKMIGHVFIDDEPASHRVVSMKVNYDNGWKAQWESTTDDQGVLRRATSGDESFCAVISCEGASPITERVEMVPGVYSVEKEFRLQSSVPLTGILVNRSGSPVKHSRLTFSPKGPEKGAVARRQTTYTNPDGGFGLTREACGSCRVEVEKMGWNETLQTIGIVYKDLGEVVVERQGEGLRLELDTGKSVTVEMRNLAGESVVGDTIFELHRGKGFKRSSLRFRTGSEEFSFMRDAAKYLHGVEKPVDTLTRVCGEFSVSWLPIDVESIRVYCFAEGVGTCVSSVPLTEQADVVMRMDLKPGLQVSLRTEDWQGGAVPGVSVSCRNVFGKGEPPSAIGATGIVGLENAWCQTDDRGEGQLIVYDLPGAELESEFVCTFPSGDSIKLRNPERYVRYTPVVIRAPLPNLILGRVLDAVAATPVSGVAVSAERKGTRETPATTETDVNGWFQLRRGDDSTNALMRVTKEGYKPRGVAVGRDELHVILLER